MGSVCLNHAYRVKSSSSSLFCRVCLGWAMFAQLGSDWSSRLMSSSLDQEALMVSFSSHWTMALMTHITQTHTYTLAASVGLVFITRRPRWDWGRPVTKSRWTPSGLSLLFCISWPIHHSPISNPGPDWNATDLLSHVSQSKAKKSAMERESF